MCVVCGTAWSGYGEVSVCFVFGTVWIGFGGMSVCCVLDSLEWVWGSE